MKKSLVIGSIVLLILFLVSKPESEIVRDTFLKSDALYLQREIFTGKEWEWIEQNKDKIFFIGVAQDYVPIEYLDKDVQPKGLGIELIKKIYEYTGLNFKLYENNRIESWAEILQSTKEKRIDILTAVSVTEDRREYLDFSLPYLELTQVLIGHKDNQIITTFNSLNRGTFAVPRGYWFLDTILINHPEDKIIYVEDTEDAIESVANKQVDYTVCELPVYAYYKEQKSYSNLKIVGLLDKNQISIAVRKDLKALIPIINKVILNINKDELFESTLVIPVNNNRELKLITMVFLLSTILLLAIYYLLKTYKKLIKAKNEAEEANNDKTMLMANISHDLRTPITVSMGYLEAVIDGETKENREEYLKRTYNKLKYLSALIDDFFFLSRLEDNKITFYKEKIKVNNILQKVADNLEFKVKSENIELVLNLASTTTVSTNIDKLKFYRAIENIIMNAIKYSKKNGRIEIGTIPLKDEKVKIYIKDNGRGIPKDDIPDIFKRYYKGKNSKKDSVGLGLYITKEIIEKHDGQIWVESQLDEGSTFYITL